MESLEMLSDDKIKILISCPKMIIEADWLKLCIVRVVLFWRSFDG